MKLEWPRESWLMDGPSRASIWVLHCACDPRIWMRDRGAGQERKQACKSVHHQGGYRLGLSFWAKKKKSKIKYTVNFEFQINNNEYWFALSMFHAIFGIPSGTRGKEPICQSRRYKRLRFDPWVGKVPWRRKLQPIPVFLMKNPMDRRGWQVIVHRVTKRQTQIKQLSRHAVFGTYF